MADTQPSYRDILCDKELLLVQRTQIQENLEAKYFLISRKAAALLATAILLVGGFTGWLAVREAARSALAGAGAQEALQQLRTDVDLATKARKNAEADADAVKHMDAELSSGLPAQRIARLENDRDLFYRDFAEASLRITRIAALYQQKGQSPNADEESAKKQLLSDSQPWSDRLIKRANDRDAEVHDHK